MIDILIGPGVAVLLCIFGGAVVWGKIQSKTNEHSKELGELEKRRRSDLRTMETSLSRKVDLSLCEAEMKHGNNRFADICIELQGIQEELKTQGKMLASINTLLAIVAKQNGVKGQT